MSSWHQEEDMALRLMRFALVFGIVLAIAVIIRTIATGVALPDSQSESTAPIAPKQTIYRPTPAFVLRVQHAGRRQKDAWCGASSSDRLLTASPLLTTLASSGGWLASVQWG
jgi:hypothetical protein